jgi:hypothetical protein
MAFEFFTDDHFAPGFAEKEDVHHGRYICGAWNSGSG